jgi:hypothetical protein
MRGAKKMNRKILRSPGMSNDLKPLLTKADPINPPTKEWETLIGNPLWVQK